MSDNINFDYKNLSPFKWFVLENFPFIEADFDALTEWQLFCKIGKEINKIIDSQNIVGEQAETLTNAFNTLKNYVDNYFNNLDVQDEINNKLNEMAESGELENLISKYLSLNALTIFNTVEDLKESDNLIIGSTVETLGFYEIGDLGKAKYKIKENLIENNYNIFKLKNNLYAELIIENPFNIMSIGAHRNDGQDNYNVFNFAINNIIKNSDITNTLYIPYGIYRFYNNLTIDYPLNIIGDSSQINYNSPYKDRIATILEDYSTDLASPFITFNSGIENKRLTGNFIKNIMINGNYQNHDCLYMFKCGWQSYYENFKIFRYNGSGLIMDNCQDFIIFNSQLINCGMFESNKYSLVLKNSTNNASFDNFHIEGGSKLIEISGIELQFINCHFEYNDPTNTDLSKKWIEILSGSTVTFNSCNFIPPKLNSLENYKDIIDDIAYAFTINSNVIANFISCKFRNSINEENKLLNISNNVKLCNFDDCIFQNLTPEIYSIRAYNSNFTNCLFNFVGNNNNVFYGLRINNCIINNCKFKTENITNIDNSTLIMIEISSKLGYNEYPTNITHIYNTLNSTSRAIDISRNSTLTTVNSNFLDNNNIDLSLVELNSSRLYFSSTNGNKTINKILNGCGNDLIIIVNATGNNIIFENTLPSGNDGRIATPLTLENSKRAILYKIGRDWAISKI